MTKHKKAAGYEIVIIKGQFSGLGHWQLHLQNRNRCLASCEAMILGFVAYGYSIFLYVHVQNTLGVAKTSDYYAVAAFTGALLSFVILRNTISRMTALTDSRVLFHQRCTGVPGFANLLADSIVPMLELIEDKRIHF